jgi:hypothetical protein
VCSLEEIESMFDEMWEAERQFLAPFEAKLQAGRAR